MKAYVIVLLLLKVSMILQFILVSIKVQKEDSVQYLISDFLFKMLLGIFLYTFFFINGSQSFDKWDARFIAFGGVLLMFDAVYNVLPKLLLKFKIYFNPYTFYLSNRPETVTTAKKEQTP